MALSTILIVDYDSVVRRNLMCALEGTDRRLLEAASKEAALKLCEDGSVDLVLVDCSEVTADILHVLKQFKEIAPDLVIIAMSSSSSVEQAVIAMKQGAFHYARKPFVLDEMLALVEKGLETTRLLRELKALHANVSEPLFF